MDGNGNRGINAKLSPCHHSIAHHLDRALPDYGRGGRVGGEPMKIIEKTITVRYREFEPGDHVTPSSIRSALDLGTVYTVTSFHHPLVESGETSGIVFVEGRKHGVDAEYLRLESEGG